VVKAPVFLTGFMGCGKSTVGSRAAELLQVPFYDLDKELERLAGRRIQEIFEKHGEGHFRSMERQALEDLLAFVGGESCLIALGGGTWVQPWARESIPAERVIFLDLPFEVLERRIALGRGRPLAINAKNLYLQRMTRYHEAGLRVPLGEQDDLERAAELVVERLRPLLT
jgi:shikimate kinase